MSGEPPEEQDGVRVAGKLIDVLGPEGEGLPVEQLQDPARLRSVVQSLLLVAEQPLSPARIVSLLGDERIDAGAVREVLQAWAAELERDGGGLRIAEIGGGYRLRTVHENAPWVRAMTRRRPVRLSRAALETAAIVAYRQPVTRAEVDEIRGVESSVVLRSLLEKELLRIAGRKEEPGRPMLYATTRRFLEVFGLRSLGDLPSMAEFKSLAVGEQAGLFPGESALDDPPAEEEQDRGPDEDDAQEGQDEGEAE